MNYNITVYAKGAPASVKALSLSKEIDGKKNKLERYGGCIPSLEREIKNAEDLLNIYLVEAAQGALESLNKIQADLEELVYREAEGYLTPEQIVQADAIYSHLETMLGIDESERKLKSPRYSGMALKSRDPEFSEWAREQ